MYFAHSTEKKSEEDWQSLSDHLNYVAQLAEAFANSFSASKAAHLCGLLHDLGKYNPAFQNYIKGKGQSVDHSSAGAEILLGEGQKIAKQRPADFIVLALLAHAVAGHHGGIANWNGGQGRSLLDRVAEKNAQKLDVIWQNEITLDTTDLLPEGFKWDGRSLKAKAFQLSLLGRMLFSCLVDADFKDTEAFYAQIEGMSIDRDWPQLQQHLPELIARFDSHMAAITEQADARNPVNQLRNHILDHVMKRSDMPAGLFTLNVPTGGGKTLCSLGFALKHALAHNKRRIIYSIPFTSIIDQTAKIFRDLLGDEMILEHHSAIEEKEFKGRFSRDKLKLAMQDWAAPVVVTTNIQFFESLFANRPSRCRKLHNIANSVIILDEAQTIPLDLLKPAVLALDELARNYGCTIVLCTATQPALEKNRFEDKELMGLDLAGKELAPDPASLSLKLRRTKIERAGIMTDTDLLADMEKAPQGLVIVNSRKHALELYKLGREEGLEGLVHLTTRQCAAHRKEILDKIRADLKNGNSCRVIATSLIEAGVDVDFPLVWRAEAGLEQVLQAAGRCNREGKRTVEESLVKVFEAVEYKPFNEIKQFVGSFKYVSNTHDDLFSPEAIEAYFSDLYWKKGNNLDAKDILGCTELARSGIDIAFREIADKFHMIQSAMLPVIVPYDENAITWINKLSFEGVPSGQIARQLQRYIVQVPPKARERLIDCGHAHYAAPPFRADQFVVLGKSSGLYSYEIGLFWEDADYLGADQWMV